MRLRRWPEWVPGLVIAFDVASSVFLSSVHIMPLLRNAPYFIPVGGESIYFLVRKEKEKTKKDTHLTQILK